MWFVTKFVCRSFYLALPDCHLLYPSLSSRNQLPATILTRLQCLDGFHQQGDLAKGGKREENEIRTFLSFFPEGILSAAGSTEATSDPKGLTQSDFIEFWAHSHLCTLPGNRWWHVCCYCLWITTLSLGGKCLPNYPTLSFLPDNNKWQKWYWNARLLVLGRESILHTHLTFIHMFIKLLATKRRALCWAQTV